MPLTKLQSHVLRVLAAERSDIDIFQDTEHLLEAAAQTDAKALTDAGLKFAGAKIATGKREAEVEGLDEKNAAGSRPCNQQDIRRRRPARTPRYRRPCDHP